MKLWVESIKWDDEWEKVADFQGGGQGSVKQVRNKKSGDIAFLKVLSRQNVPERRARFFREATAYSTFQHPSIPALIQSNAHSHTNLDYKLFIITEFIQGPTLKTLVDKSGPFQFEEASSVLFQLIEVVYYYHDRNWVHRDIKPDNIILKNSDANKPVLVDFGLGYKDGITEDFQTEHGQEIGNRFIRLPELAAGSPLKQDVRSDIAFLGGVFFYLLSGIAPFSLIDAEGRMPHQR